MKKLIGLVMLITVVWSCAVMPGDDKEDKKDDNSYRITRYGNSAYTYDENGFVSAIEELRWGKGKTVYTISGGKRVSFESFEYDYDNKVLKTTPSQYGSISHDAINREISHKYYLDTAKTFQVREVTIDYTSEAGKKIITYYDCDGSDPENIIKYVSSIRIYDLDGKLISRESFNPQDGMNNINFWSYFYRVASPDPEMYPEVYVKSIKVLYEYSPKSNKVTKESIYSNDVLLFETTYTMNSKGVFQHGVVKQPDGLIVGEIHFGELFSYGDLKAQSAYMSINASSNFITVEAEYAQTELYDSDYNGCGTIMAPVEKEVGITVEGQYLY